MGETYVVEMTTVVCPSCGVEYKNSGISNHWALGGCDYPDLNQTQKDIALGLMLGDGGLHRETRNASILISSTTKSFLEWIDHQAGWLCTGSYTKTDGEYMAQYDEDHGRNVDGDKDYKDTWTIQLRCHPYFNRYREWYEEKNGRQVAVAGEDVWMSPTVVKVWWVSDGHFRWNDGGSGCATITSENNTLHLERFSDLFKEEIGIRPRTNYRRLIFGVHDTKEFLEYMGDPIPGFYEKWCPNRERYEIVSMKF